MNFDKFLFPHEKVRDIQEQLLLKIDEVIKKGDNLIAHAPTGLGKTAAALSPCLKYALDNDKVVFFLTSRHTQHKLAIDTLAEIQSKHNKKFNAVSIIGKKGLCLQPGVQTLYTGEFYEYCRAMREDKKCEFYTNYKNKDKLSVSARSALAELKIVSPAMTEETLRISEKHAVCPYELSLSLSKDSRIIIGDYNYIFHPDISANFLKRMDRELKDIIVVVDEAHNLPNRVKDLFTSRLTSLMLTRAVSEAKKFKLDQIRYSLIQLRTILTELSDFHEEERYIKKESFVDKVNQIQDYQELIGDLATVADDIREAQRQSYIGSIADFLEAWLGGEEGFTRIISKQMGAREEIKVLSYRCLDPSLSTKSVIEAAHSTIMMSGTLTPTSMYKELLGFDAQSNEVASGPEPKVLSQTEEETYKSPFPEENRLNIIIPKTSTKYELRSREQYKDIATIMAKVVNKVPGNSAVFFPSYYLRDQIYKDFNDSCNKTIFTERPGLSKTEKHEMLEKFKSYKDTGAVLLAVISGSFGEGIDLPGDYLKCVVIVGLPLSKPDLESKALINYYDEKFGKGWDYGYLYPAFNKTLQSAGRCIRSGSDKGVIVFLDERYTWQNYHRCFPASWSIKTTMLYEKMIQDFFKAS